MKHVELSEGEARRFRVWCSHRNKYVLDGVSEAEVQKYFAQIALERATDAVRALVREAVAAGPVRPREARVH